jgi:hypothetical protein
VEYKAPEPCGKVIENRHIIASTSGEIRQTFTAPTSSSAPRDYNPCLIGIYKATFTNEINGEALSVNFSVFAPVE